MTSIFRAVHALSDRAAIVAFAAVWAVMEIITAMAGVNVEQVVWLRYAVHLLTMLVFFAPRRWKTLVGTRQLPLQIFRSLLMLGLPLAFVVGALHMGVVEIMTVFWLFPLMITAFDGAARRSSRQWIAAGVGYLGVLILQSPHEGVLRLAAVLPFAMGLCFALYQTLTEHLTEEADVTNVFHSALWVFLALTPRMPFVWQTPSTVGWFALAAIGLFSPFLLYLLDMVAKRDGLSRLAPVMYLQVVFATGAVMMLTRQRPHGPAILGTLLILAAAALAAPRRAGEPAALATAS